MVGKDRGKDRLPLLKGSTEVERERGRRQGLGRGGGGGGGGGRGREAKSWRMEIHQFIVILIIACQFIVILIAW